MEGTGKLVGVASAAGACPSVPILQMRFPMLTSARAFVNKPGQKTWLVYKCLVNNVWSTLTVAVLPRALILSPLTINHPSP